MIIFGIKIDNINKSALMEKINEFLVGEKQHFIVTPNPEFLLEAGKDEEFFYILNQADLALPDGIGLKFAGWAMGENLARIAGADLVPEILKLAEDKILKIGIINWAGGLSKKEDIENILKQKFSKLNFMVCDVDRNAVETHNYASLHAFNPTILFVTLGAPYQEKFIYYNLKNLPSVKLAMGVGASFDYISGKARRAPQIMRNLGLEWLWRLFGALSGQKNRGRRIYNAVVKFTLKFLKWRFILPWLYRPSVACLLYKKEGEQYKILIVRRAEAKDEHWQLPQGGTNHENIETAGRRELSEELNCDKFKTVSTFKNLFKYKFPQNMAGQKHDGYKGQTQSLFIAEFTGQDSDIKINFWDHTDWKWIDAESLAEKVYPVRRESAEIFLEKFYSLKN